MNKQKIFQQIKNELTEKEQMVLASMLDGDSVVDTAHNCGISLKYAQSNRKTTYEVVGKFVDYGADKKQKQQILVDFLQGYEQATTVVSAEEIQPEETVPGEAASAKEKTEISPAYQELFSYMLDQHDCTLLESEMQEVYRIVNDDLQNDNQKMCSKIQELATMHANDIQTIKTKLCNALDIAFVPNETEFDEIFERIETLRKQQDKNIFKDFKTKTPNYLVFNPKKGSPNKVYKNYQTALEDAKAVAKKEQQSVFVLHIDSLVVPQCSFDVHDVLESGIPERYLNDDIPF